MENGVFNSFIKPILDDEKAKAAGLDPIEQDSLDLTHITREQLENAPSLEAVWKSFADFVKSFNKDKVKYSEWDAPIMAGFNIVNFDSVIIDRCCEQFGPWDKVWSSQKLFHPVQKIDIMHDFFRWTENLKINRNNSISMDSIREWLGINKDGSHNALKDVLDGAYCLIKFLKLYRHFTTKVIWEGSFAKENDLITEFLKKHS